MRFGSVCSGIEAASVAFEPLGWSAAWLAEIEPFPSAVLAHHYPDVPNLGNMTAIPRRLLAGEIEAPDMLCGGTPCQAFSVAGLRESLSDERGNLTLTFVEIADAIDHVRALRGAPPAIIVWENVPGVLSTKDNAFGCFLAGLAGEDGELQPPGGRWEDAGAVYGPARAVAWRTLDAQYFGLAQRRRRVFVVASARAGFDPAAVLLEWQGLRRDTAPRREAGQEPAAGTLRSADDGSDVDHARAGHVVGALTAAAGPNSHGGSGLATDKGAEAGHILAFGGNRTSGPIDVTPALLAQSGSGWNGDFESETFIATAHTLRGEGFDASKDGAGRGTPLVPVAFHHNAQAAQLPTADRDTSISDSLTCSQQAAVALAFKPGQSEAAGATFVTKEYAPTLQQAQNNGSTATPAVMTPAMQVRRLTPRECERLQGFPDDYTAIPWRNKPAADCPDGPRYKALGNSWAVPVVRWIGERIFREVKRRSVDG